MKYEFRGPRSPGDSRRSTTPLWRGIVLFLGLLVVAQSAVAAKIALKDGRIIDGDVFPLDKLRVVVDVKPTEGDGKRILLIDDHLRRVFVPKDQVKEVAQGVEPATEKFRVRNNKTPDAGARVAQLGAILRTTDFDEFGRRILTVQTTKGPIDIVQGITEINPTWTKIEALDTNQAKSLILDQRYATSSIPRQALTSVLSKLIGDNKKKRKIDDRLAVVRLFVAGGRLDDARDELEKTLAEFPEEGPRFLPRLKEIHQAAAQRALDEIELRRNAGQHQLAHFLLTNFPREDVAGETLQAVKKTLETYEEEAKSVADAIALLNSLVKEIERESDRDAAEKMAAEISAQLNWNTLERMAAFRQFSDPELKAEKPLTAADKVSLAISGWLVGTNDATSRLSLALSMAEVRELCRKYMLETVRQNRAVLIDRMRSQEAATPEIVVRVLNNMLPPMEAPPMLPNEPGMFELSVDGVAGQPPIIYYVQLPPGYDPHRRYPTIITLHGGSGGPNQNQAARRQIDWWAGPWNEAHSLRMGQATRHGYIVIAPHWTKDKQKEYSFTAEEHAAVLYVARDAHRRFSIDHDRVYLSGYGMGADAAWDIGQSHPDLWAGVIPVAPLVPDTLRFFNHYKENAKRLPLYFVTGELDGDQANRHASIQEHYLKAQPSYPVTLVQYQGRGREHFSDEILHLFDWMGRYQRDFHQKQFACRTMRLGDDSFWWIEASGFPNQMIVTAPESPIPKSTKAGSTTGKIGAKNNIVVTTAASQVTVWLSPELIDFKAPFSLQVNSKKFTKNGQFIEPSLEVILDDATSRGDRQHPFWAKVEMPVGEVNRVTFLPPR